MPPSLLLCPSCALSAAVLHIVHHLAVLSAVYAILGERGHAPAVGLALDVARVAFSPAALT